MATSVTLTSYHTGQPFHLPVQAIGILVKYQHERGCRIYQVGLSEPVRVRESPSQVMERLKTRAITTP